MPHAATLDPIQVGKIDRQCGPGLCFVTVSNDGRCEHHLTLSPLPSETPAQMAARLADYLKQNRADVVRHEVFGALSLRADFCEALSKAMGEIDWPITWLAGTNGAPESISGMHVLAVSGIPVETLEFEGRPVGRSFRDGWARHLLLGDVQPTDLELSKPEQSRQVFENLEAALQQGGMKMTDLGRTWLFLNDILSWYVPLNKVRNEFFRERGLFDHLVPASTGVSATNPAGSAMVAGAWAVQPDNGAFTLREALSPLQCPAPCYGSSFCRAVEMATPTLRRLLVSGTASIEPGGSSVHETNVRAQIDLTMEVVDAILKKAGFDFSQVSRATAYFKHPKDIPVFGQWMAKHGISGWPLVSTQAHICREELLFEIELDTLAEPAVKGQG